MIPIANANTSNSPPGIGLTYLLLLSQFHRVSKNLGIINNAISDLLPSGSKETVNPDIKAAIAGFQPKYHFQALFINN